MPKKVFVTGIGMITAIGNSVSETMESIYSLRSGIGEISNINTVHKENIPFAEVKATNEELLTIAGIEGQKGYTRTALLGLIAAKEALACSGIEEMKEFRTGLISATSVGGMDRSEHFYKDFLKDNNKGKLEDVITHDCGESTEKIADYLAIKDFVTTISTACSSSANSIMLGARMIRSGLIDRVIAGGTDSLTKFTLNGFNTLMILDNEACKPFDDNRNGLTLGEGAGFMVLESEDVVNGKGKDIICELKGYGNACDAFHQTASSPEGYGAYLAIKKALETGNILPGDINYINAHGTGTLNNDLSEGRAIEKIFNSKTPPVSSTKPFTGHTLGAAGGVEAVLSALAIKHQVILPNLNFSEQMKELSFSPVKELLTGVEINNVLSNSFGFGGNNTALIFSNASTSIS